LLEEFLQVRIGLRAVFLGFAGDDIDREEGARLAVEVGPMLVDELEHGGPVLAVADAGADDDLVERGEVDVGGILDLAQ
jgi:hypothetical protein